MSESKCLTNSNPIRSPKNGIQDTHTSASWRHFIDGNKSETWIYLRPELAIFLTFYFLQEGGGVPCANIPKSASFDYVIPGRSILARDRHNFCLGIAVNLKKKKKKKRVLFFSLFIDICWTQTKTWRTMNFISRQLVKLAKLEARKSRIPGKK